MIRLAKDIHDALGISTEALVGLSETMPQIRGLMVACSARLKDFVAAIDDTADQGLWELAQEVSTSASQLAALCDDADARCVTASKALRVVQEGVRISEIPAGDVASIVRSGNDAVAQLAIVQGTIAAAERQLQQERDLLLELSLLHDVAPKSKAIAAAAIRRAKSTR